MMLHTIVPYWETLVAHQAASTPVEYLVAVCLFGLMVVGFGRAPSIVGLTPIPVRKD